jgi:hypothetical protein
MEGMKKSTQDKPHKGAEARVAVVNVEATGRPPKKCRFAEALGCTGIHPRWKCTAFGDIDPDKREKIIEDEKMCPFCLLHSVEDVCYAKLTDTKPACLRPECKGDHIQWLHARHFESRHRNTSTKGTVEEGSMNMVEGFEGWRTPDESWLDMEAAEDGEKHSL